MLRVWLVIGMVPLALSLAGCTGEVSGGSKVKTVPLAGKVTLDGKPHGPASMQFIPQSAEGGTKAAYAEVKADGTFTATTYVTGDGIIPGKYDVTLGGEADAGSTDPAKMMAAIQGASIEKTSIDVPADGLPDVEIKLTSSKGGQTPAGAGTLLGQ